MHVIHARFAVALGLSTVAHVGLAWVASDHLPSTAAPAQRALTVALAPAAPRAVLNSIAPTASAALSPAVVHPVAPRAVPVIDEPDAVIAARLVDRVEVLDAPLVELRGPERVVRASAAPAATIAFAVAPSEVRITKAVQREIVEKPLPPSLDPAPATSRKIRPASATVSPGQRRPAPSRRSVDGDPGAGSDAASRRAVAGAPGADRQARPASGNAPPEYPWTARAQGHQGRVILSVWVDADGDADRLDVLQSSGYPTLDRAAMEAVGRWRFRPARRGGVETGSLLYVPVVFRLNDGG